MSFKNDVLDLLRSILKEQNATRHAILHQTNLLERGKLPPFINIHDQPTEYPKEVAPAPKAITWQEAARVLAGAAKGHCKTCELQKVCAGNFRRCAEAWEVPADE